MAKPSPFGQPTRLRVLQEYFATAGILTDDNAWEHVYHCLLWMNLDAGLAHIYDSNHMQRGGNFHSRAVRFTELLCERWNIEATELPSHIDFLFKGCIEHWRESQRSDEVETSGSALVSMVEKLLQTEGLPNERAHRLARRIEAISRDYFTIGRKRSNALGEGFEDMLAILLNRVSQIPEESIGLRTPVSRLPGFRRAPILQKGMRRDREPIPDIAITEGDITHVIATAKWSMRQDRETQFQSEYSAIQSNKTQSTELRYALITNEFDVPRLLNVLNAIPGGAGGYTFHNVYHINLELLSETQGERFKILEPWVGTGRFRSLSDFLADMRSRYGHHTA